MIQIYGPVPVYKKKVERKPNCICDNIICNNEFYRHPCEMVSKKNFCSNQCKHEDKELFIFSGTITLYKDWRKAGTANFTGREQLKWFMRSMYYPGKFETYFSIKFNSNPNPERSVATEV